MQYILLIYNNCVTQATSEEWEIFFTLAKESGLFKGGGEMDNGHIIGNKLEINDRLTISGYMRFDADDKGDLLRLLDSHPVVVHGGTVKLFELPIS